MSHAIPWGKSFRSRGKSKYKGSEVGTSAYSRTSKEASMAEANWIGSGQKVRESEFTCSS